MEVKMNSRERIIKTLTFQPVDRIPFIEWNIRKATMREWVSQGYPEGVHQKTFFDLDPGHLDVPVQMGMFPAFEEKIIEQNDKYKIWQDDLGAIRKDFTDNENPGFVTRSWLSFPVKDRNDFLEMKKRYDWKEPLRYPENWKLRARILNEAPVANHLSIPFLFWTARDWMGFENLCLAFYDMPELVEEMFGFLTDFCIETLKRGIDDLRIDIVELKEDMAYKHAPMISPEMFKRFMLPHYKRMVSFLKSHGVKVVYVDCDGYPGGLIPLWIEAGVDGMSPCEIAAGNDMLELRKQYPGFALFGGIDKRELTKDRKAIYSEVMSKVPCLIEKGGYIPHIDHAIPFDVPLENYLYYRKLLTAIAYGDPVDEPV
jgi:uroporphyrinogen decarboxylase